MNKQNKLKDKKNKQRSKKISLSITTKKDTTSKKKNTIRRYTRNLLLS